MTSKPKIVATAATSKQAPRRRRRRRRTNKLLSQRLITEVNQKKRQFLREVSQMLTDALGFQVRVSLVQPRIEMTPGMRRAARMTVKQSRRQIADSAGFGAIDVAATKRAARSKITDKRLNDDLPF